MPPMFAHASSIEVVTPEGRMAQYYLGVEYSPRDLRLGLVEASHNTIGTPVDNILTYCYRYDPKLNRHSLVICTGRPGRLPAHFFGPGELHGGELPPGF